MLDAQRGDGNVGHIPVEVDDGISGQAAPQKQGHTHQTDSSHEHSPRAQRRQSHRHRPNAGARDNASRQRRKQRPRIGKMPHPRTGLHWGTQCPPTTASSRSLPPLLCLQISNLPPYFLTIIAAIILSVRRRASSDRNTQRHTESQTGREREEGGRERDRDREREMEEEEERESGGGAETGGESGSSSSSTTTDEATPALQEAP